MILFLVYEQEKVYQDNIEASVSALKKLSDGWKEQSAKLSPYESLRDTLKNFKQKVISNKSKDLHFQFIVSGIAFQHCDMDWLDCVLLYWSSRVFGHGM